MKHITQLLSDQKFKCPADLSSISISGLSCDSRLTQNNDLFFAIPGTKDDGTKYIHDALAKGAIAIVVESPLTNLKIPVIQVQNVRTSLALAAQNFYDSPTSQLHLCGVTGTNGKTTLTYLLESLWASRKSGIIGTVNTRYAGQIIEASHTTPDSIQLQKIFADMLHSHVTHAAIEVSSHALDQQRVAGCDFDTAIFTNLTQDHLDYHGTMENYFSAKSKFFTEVLPASRKPLKKAVINIDDSWGQKLIELIPSNITIKTYSLEKSSANLFVDSATTNFKGTKGIFIWDGERLPFQTNLIGAHNLQNIMAALLGAESSENSKLDLITRMLTIAVPGRLERVGQKAHFVDYAHTPDALLNVTTLLKNLRDQTHPAAKLIVVFGCGGDRDKTKRPLMGAIAAELADIAVVTSDNPRTENPEQILADILPGVQKHKVSFAGETGYVVEVDREAAIAWAVKNSGADDIILVAGKGHEDYQIIGTTKRHFDDREILRKFNP